MRVQPRSSRNAISGVHASALKVKVTPPAEGGRANAACLRILSEALSIPRGSLDILRGDRGREKLILVAGLPPDEVRRRLSPFVEGHID